MNEYTGTKGDIMSEEINQTTCKECQQIKPRIRSDDMYPNGSTHKFKDEKGKLWSGRRCPECQRSRAKVNMKKLFNERKEVRDLLLQIKK